MTLKKLYIKLVYKSLRTATIQENADTNSVALIRDWAIVAVCIEQNILREKLRTIQIWNMHETT